MGEQQSTTETEEKNDEQTIEICGKQFGAGDSINDHPDFDGDVVKACNKLMSGDSDRYGNVRGGIWETPDGDYLELSYRTDGQQIFEERPHEAQPAYGTAYHVVQVGSQIHTETLVGDEQDVIFEDECRDYILGHWEGVYDVQWGDKVSLSAVMDGWEWYCDQNGVTVEDLRAAGRFDITFRVNLVNEGENA